MYGPPLPYTRRVPITLPVHALLFDVAVVVLGLDIVGTILYLRKHRRWIDPF